MAQAMYHIQLCVHYLVRDYDEKQILTRVLLHNQDFQGITTLRRHNAKKRHVTLAVEMAQNLPHLPSFSPSPLFFIAINEAPMGRRTTW